MVNLLLCAINLLTSADYLWFVWPLLGWGIGLASHAFGVVSKEWQERRVRALLERGGLWTPERRRADEDEQLWPNL